MPKEPVILNVPTQKFRIRHLVYFCLSTYYYCILLRTEAFPVTHCTNPEKLTKTARWVAASVKRDLQVLQHARHQVKTIDDVNSTSVNLEPQHPKSLGVPDHFIFDLH